jgi:pyruvate/2-oxoglutarate dehydrogenase complex dihydrolipoamide acyltransferase (E2) component
MIVELAIGAAIVAALAKKRPAAADPPITPDPAPPLQVETIPPPKASAKGWVQLQDAPGLEVRLPARSWTSPAVRELLLSAGQVAASLGGKIQLGDVGPPDRGAKFDPHLSHRWGRDMDWSYISEVYPTPDDVPVDPRILAVLDALTPYIEKVGVNVVRLPPFAGHPFKVVEWKGHAHHLHLRLRSNLVDQPQLAAAMLGPGSFAELGDVDEGDDEG